MKNQNNHPKQLIHGEKKIWVVEDHQYVLPLWGRLSLKNNQPYVLVSIDYHPDTNPPFWLYAYQKAIAKDPMREETLVLNYQQQLFKTMDAQEIKSIEAVMDHMRNDEHIHTALALGYLKEYHMINCMKKHCYEEGQHYLVSKKHQGSLSDQAFKRAGFLLDSQEKHPLILDIDLDYFSNSKELDYCEEEMKIFASLVNSAEMITIARSKRYFDYLKKENFSLEVCEEKLFSLLKKIFEND